MSHEVIFLLLGIDDSYNDKRIVTTDAEQGLVDCLDDKHRAWVTDVMAMPGKEGKGVTCGCDMDVQTLSKMADWAYVHHNEKLWKGLDDCIYFAKHGRMIHALFIPKQTLEDSHENQHS